MSGDIRSRIDTGALAGGVIMITVGVLFLLSRMDFADFGQILRRYWPVIIMIVGVTKLFARDTVWTGLWLVTLGIWLQISHLEIFGLTYSSSWPLLLIALGGGMILRSFVEAALRSREGHHEG
jgi:hypothetical protein